MNPRNHAHTLAVLLLILMRLRRGNWCGTADLREWLHDNGHDVTQRTVQRHLVKLAEWFPLEHDGQNPKGWRWCADVNIDLIEALQGK